jgi:hypothetical protein
MNRPKNNYQLRIMLKMKINNQSKILDKLVKLNNNKINNIQMRNNLLNLLSYKENLIFVKIKIKT